ncbi:MAG: metallophosphoesterase [Acidobacteriota bacterium]|nr:metallophosphoesterase [Acidobacteriota bacterium]
MSRGAKNIGRWFAAFLVPAALLLATACSGISGRTGVAGRPDRSEPWRFAVVSDTQGDNRDGTGKSGLNDSVIKALAEAVVREKADFVLVSGDLINGWFKNGGTEYAVQYAHWREAMRPVYQAGIRIYPIRGNHDDGPERLALPPLPARLEPPAGTPEKLKRAFREAFPEAYIPGNGPAGEERLTYSFVHKNALIVGLDQFSGSEHKVNQAWLDKQLAGSGGRHVFVYGHEPAFETNHKDNLSFFPEDRDRFWDSLGAAGARVYFCGHDHFYNRALIRDRAGHEIRQIIAGTGGGSLKAWPGAYGDKRVIGEFHDDKHRGFLLVTIEGFRVTIEWKALLDEGGTAVWKALDAFRYSLRPAP